MSPALDPARHILARLDQLEALRDALESALDWLPIGYLLVDCEGRVLKANRAAQAMVQRCDGLSMSGEMLEASDGQAAVTLREAIRRASDGEVQAAAAFGGIVHISRARARPLTVILVPIQPPRGSVDLTEPRAARRIFVTRRPVGPQLRQLLKPNRPQLVSPATTPGVRRRCLVALLIPEGEIGLQKSGHLLRHLYGLTQREADVASDLLQGHRVSDIARLRELSVNTVRTHLKRLLEKTRTTRQADLLRVLVASFPPVEYRSRADAAACPTN
jgi:DNA-binding CsgD family transcriptional regulator